MTKPWIVASSLIILAAGCSGRYPAAKSATTPAAPAAKAQRGHAKDSGFDLARAAVPYKILRARGGTEVAPEQFFDEIARGAGVCLGETHPNPHHHWAQLRVLEEVVVRRNGGKMALGMEMFQRPFQGVLDDYAAGRIDEGDMLSRTDWVNRWGYDFALYRPLMQLAVKREIPILALNVSTELKEKIKRKGIEGLTTRDRAQVPDIDLEDADHKAWFTDLMAEMGGEHGHGQSSGKSDEELARKIYFSQVLWDETMADTAARWLEVEAGRYVVIVAGSGHCHDSAIVRRMKRRGAGAIVSIRPVMQGNEAKELANPYTDYLFVLIPPR